MKTAGIKRKLEQEASGRNTRPITAFFRNTSTKKVNGENPGKILSTVVKQNGALDGSRFNKETWINSLTAQQRELLDLEINTLHESWLSVLYKELTESYFLDLKKFLKSEKDRKTVIFPADEDIYSWSRLTPLNTVKVVILGQDPYHNYNQAHGLAFSVKPPTTAPPSLKNIFKGLKNCYEDFEEPSNGLLTPWATRGVLLLNACLTVRAHNANSHAGKGWETFTEQVLAAAAQYRSEGICFLVWGSPAGKRIDKINPNKSLHLVLRSVHPSPLSASRGFFTCGHFRKANEWLEQRYGPEGVIDWSLKPGNSIVGNPAVKVAGGVLAVPKETNKQITGKLAEDDQVEKGQDKTGNEAVEDLTPGKDIEVVQSEKLQVINGQE